MLDFLKHTNDLVAPSGYEMDVLGLWSDLIRPYVDEVYSDTLGNVVALRKGKALRKIMIAAHSDEIGLIIKYIDESGFLYFDEIGGVDTALLPGRLVRIRNRKGEYVSGVIGAVPIHLQDNKSNIKELEPDQLWIDIGAANNDEASRKVGIGDVAVLESGMLKTGSRLIGRAMYNRCSLSSMIEVARIMRDWELENDIYFVATTQEELRARGAQTVAFSIKPDICVVLDVTHATDYPSMSVIKRGNIALSKGVVVAVGPNMTHKVSDDLISICQRENISFQIEALGKPTGTDANPIQLVRSGVAVGLLSIPCRYMHSPVETIDYDDLQTVIELLCKYIKFVDDCLN